MRKCIICEKEIHPKRLAILPNATKCVACSDTNKKAGVTVTKGKGDHTYNDIVIMDHEEYVKYHELESKKYGKREDEITHPDEDDAVEGSDSETDLTEL